MKNKWVIRKLVEFECAHQLTNAVTNLCNATIHGHSYKCEIFLEAYHLLNDMVLDFGAIKNIKERVMIKYDHALFMPERLKEKYNIELDDGEDYLPIDFNNMRITWVPFDPSAERMAEDIYKMVDVMLDDIPETWSIPGIRRVRLTKVRVHETRTGWAEYSEGEN